MWQPSPDDIAWARMMIRITKNGGMWGSSIGIYKMDHTNKKLILTNKSPIFSQEQHDMNVTCFGKIGYKVEVDPNLV